MDMSILGAGFVLENMNRRNPVALWEERLRQIEAFEDHWLVRAVRVVIHWMSSSVAITRNIGLRPAHA